MKISFEGFLHEHARIAEKRLYHAFPSALTLPPFWSKVVMKYPSILSAHTEDEYGRRAKGVADTASSDRKYMRKLITQEINIA